MYVSCQSQIVPGAESWLERRASGGGGQQL